jgi:hypothetical protein
MFVVTISVPMIAKLSDTYAERNYSIGLSLFAWDPYLQGFHFPLSNNLSQVVQSVGPLDFANSIPLSRIHFRK